MSIYNPLILITYKLQSYIHLHFSLYNSMDNNVNINKITSKITLSF